VLIWSTLPTALTKQLEERWQRILLSAEEDEWIFTILPSSSSDHQLRVTRLVPGCPSQSFRLPRENSHVHGGRHHSTHAPLGAVVGPYIRVEKIRQHPSCSPELSYLLDLTVTDDRISEFLPSSSICERRYISRHFGDIDMDTLCSPGVIKESADIAFCHPAFKVPKKSNSAASELESRFILNCKSLNSLIQSAGFRAPSMGLSMLSDIVDSVLKKGYSCYDTIDAKSFFYQIPLFHKLQKWFGFLTAGRRGRFRRFVMRSMPMGFFLAPATAQHISNFFISLLLATVPNIAAFVWLDNFMIFAYTRGVLETAKQELQKILVEFNVEMKGWTGETGLLGLDFDLAHGKVRLSPDFLNKLLSRPEWWSDTASPLAFLGLAGSIIYGNYAVLRTPLCFFPHFMSHLTAVSKAVSCGSSSPIPYSIELTNELSLLFSIFRDSPDYSYQVPLRGCPVWSDASISALAAVVEWGALDICMSFLPSSGEHLSPRHIFLAEALAAEMVLSQWPAAAHLVTDNTSLFYAIRKGHSSSALLNESLRAIYASPLSSWEWRPTHEQRADGITRGTLPAPRSLHSSLDTPFICTRRFFPSAMLCR
jgi:hypothetical protein